MVYWCRSKTCDRVEEFMINAAKMIVKMVVPQWPTPPKKNSGSTDSANPAAVNVNVM